MDWFADMEVTRYLARVTAISLQQEIETIKRLGEAKDTVWWVIEAEGKAIGTSGIHGIDWIIGRGHTGTG